MGANQNRVRNRVGFINRKTYNEFIKKHPNTNTTYKEFITVLKESTIAIRDFILENELGFKLPFNLGYIAVDKFKIPQNKQYVDWINTRKIGKIIPLTNFHSFGYLYKVKLFKNPKIQPLKGYHMEAHRVIKRMLCKNIVQDTRQYLEIDRSCFNKRFSIESFLNKENK